jgi:membrane associated rhomboid family serine protease/Flp pilus assembly protein TadD
MRYRQISFLLALVYAVTYIFEFLATNGKVLLFASPEVLLNLGGSWGVGTIACGQYWRLLTAIFLHASLLHLVLNIYVLLDFCSLAEEALGHAKFLFIYIFCGLMGSIASMIWDPTQLCVGASAANVGVIGAFLLASWQKRIPEQLAFSKPQIVVLSVFFLYSFLLGLTSEFIDNTAHLSGLVAGIVAGFFLTAKPKNQAKLLKARPGQVLALLTLIPVAVAIANKRMEKNPLVDAAIFHQEGVKLLEAKKYLHGLELLNKAVALRPSYPSYLRDRATAFLELEQPSNALKDISKALELDPKDSAIYGTRANLYHELGDNKKALADLDQAISIRPKGAMLYNNRAWIKLSDRDLEGALKDCQEALKLESRMPNAIDTLGFIHFLQGDFEKAEKELKECQKLAPKEGASYYHLALLHLKLKKDEEANSELLKAKELGYKPENWEPQAIN